MLSFDGSSRLSKLNPGGEVENWERNRIHASDGYSDYLVLKDVFFKRSPQSDGLSRYGFVMTEILSEMKLWFPLK